MEPPKIELMSEVQHYIITDDKGYIANVTEGLTAEMGLNSKFFNYSDENVHAMINIQQLWMTIMDPDSQ